MSRPEHLISEGIQANQREIDIYYALLQQMGQSIAPLQLANHQVTSADFINNTTTTTVVSNDTVSNSPLHGDSFLATSVIDDDDDFSAAAAVTNGSAGSEIHEDETISRLYQHIFEQQIKADAAVGICSAFIEVDGKKVLLRNAKGANDKLPPEEYAAKVRPFHAKRMALNYLMALQRINISYNLGIQSRDLLSLIEFYDVAIINKQPEEDILKLLTQWCNEHILQRIVDAFNQKAGHEHKDSNTSLKLFQRMTHIVAMEHATVDTVTLSHVNGKDILQHETPATPSLLGIAELAKELDEKTLEQKVWFRALSKEDKEIVRLYRPYVLMGDRTIPSQCRDLLPGIRNAFNAKVYLRDDDLKLNCILNTVHTGTVVTLVKTKNGVQIAEADHEMQRLTRFNMHLLNQSQGENCSILVTSLNSGLADVAVFGSEYVNQIGKNFLGAAIATITGKSAKQYLRDRIPYFGDDRAIVNNTLWAGQQHQGFDNDPRLLSSNFVFNGFRAVSSDDVVGSYALLENAKYLVGILKTHPLTKDSTTQLESWLTQLEALLERRGDNAVKIFGKNVLAGDAMDESFAGKRILQLVALISSEVNRLHDENKARIATWLNPPQKIIHAFGCASGENRTYAGLLHATVAAILEHETSKQQAIFDFNLSTLHNKDIPAEDRIQFLKEAATKDAMNGFLSPEEYAKVFQCLVDSDKPAAILLTSAIDAYTQCIGTDTLELSIVKSLAYNGHFPAMIGAQGGVLGGAFARKKSVASFTKSYQAYHPLFCDKIADLKKNVRRNADLYSQADQFIRELLQKIQFNLISPNSDYRNSIKSSKNVIINLAGTFMEVPKEILDLMDQLQDLREELYDNGTYGNIHRPDSLITIFLWEVWHKTKNLLDDGDWQQILPVMKGEAWNSVLDDNHNDAAVSTWNSADKRVSPSASTILLGFTRHSPSQLNSRSTATTIVDDIDDGDDDEDKARNPVTFGSGSGHG